MEHHETALELSTLCNSLPVQIKSASQLCGVYRVLAENLLEEGKKSAQSAADKKDAAEGTDSKKDEKKFQVNRSRQCLAAADLYEKCVACSRLSKDIKLEGIRRFCD